VIIYKSVIIYIWLLSTTIIYNNSKCGNYVDMEFYYIRPV